MNPTESVAKSIEVPRVDRQRLKWIEQRRQLEISRHTSQIGRGKSRKKWDYFVFLVKIFGVLLRITGLYKRGFINALSVQLQKIELPFENLPINFEGFRILHITDPHLTSLPGLEKVLVNLLKGTKVDIVVMTGDFQDKPSDYPKVFGPLEQIVNSVESKEGTYTTFGNHDTVKMIAPFEERGIKVLGNQTIAVRRGQQVIYFTGIDDVHYFYSEMANEALAQSPTGFKIALVHSPDMLYQAEQHGYSLYLSGHTHGGQVCLPSGIPIFSHTQAGRQFARGLWRFGRLLGYTSNGAGAVGVPVRFNCPGEVTLITLKTKGN